MCLRCANAGNRYRFVLFSEFVLDLPSKLPASLANVPHADSGADALVADLCETLRNDNRTRQTYIDRAEQIERALDLPATCAEIKDLGKLDTFPFEERTFLQVAVDALKDDRLDEVRTVVDRHKNSVWLGQGESQAQWGLVSAALQLVSACEDADRNLSGNTGSLDALIDHYTSSLREIDSFKEATVLSVPGQQRVRAIEFLPNSETLVICDDLGVTIWPLLTGEPIRLKCIAAEQSEVVAAAFDGKTIAVASRSDDVIRIVNPEDDVVITTLKPQ